ncbi:hypothetical protein Tco_1493828 [Tanacetum coccineum]
MKQVKTKQTIQSLSLAFTKIKPSKHGESGGGTRLLCRGCGGGRGVDVEVVRILQISHENGQNRTNTDTGMERVHKSREFDSKKNKDSSTKLTTQPQKVTRSHDWLAMTRGNDAWTLDKHTPKGDFCTKTSAKETRNSKDMGLPAWQSVCLQFDPRATRGHLMIGKDSRVKIKTERSVYPRPRSFSQAYKYKTFFTHRISFAYRV